MPSNAASPKWTRLLPKQFSMRTLLVLITITALFLWWFFDASRGNITELQARRFQDGASEAQVIALLGKPYRRLWKTNGQTLSYRIYDPVDGDYVGSLTLLVASASGKVSVLEHRYNGKPLLGR
jgi:hypothetical protein